MFQLNPEQQSAVENIVFAKNFPLPYILIGPPGEHQAHARQKSQ